MNGQSTLFNLGLILDLSFKSAIIMKAVICTNHGTLKICKSRGVTPY